MRYDASNTALFFQHSHRIEVTIFQKLTFPVSSQLIFLLIQLGETPNAASICLISYFPELQLCNKSHTAVFQ